MNHIRKDKNNVRPIIFQIVLDALKGLNMSSPVTDAKRRTERNQSARCWPSAAAPYNDQNETV